MSRIEKCGNFIRGCALLFEGEEDTPLPRASMAITWYLDVSTSLPGPSRSGRSAVVPVNHVELG